MLADLTLLRVLPLRFTAAALDPLELSAFPSSTLRGVFGHALKDTVCVVAHRDCDSCHLAHACVFPYLFETRPPADSARLKGAPAAPHPYRLQLDDSDRTVAVDETFEFDLTLIGRATELLPAILAAVERAGERGLTSRRQRFAVRRIEARPIGAAPLPVLTAGTGVTLPEAGAKVWRIPPLAGSPQRVEVRFASPVRLQHDGRFARDVPFHVLVRSLLRRASSLLEFHEGIDLQLDFRGLIGRAEAVVVERADLRKENRLRYSSRQQRMMNLIGLRGAVTYRGDVGPFAPLLALGEAVGVGKSTTFGLGSMVVSWDAARATDG